MMQVYCLMMLILLFTITHISICTAGGRGSPSKGNSKGNHKGKETKHAIETEYYKALGLNKQQKSSITASDLKKAFHKKAMKMHPDKGGDTEQFKIINEAYEVLSDPQKRQIYDRYGKKGLDPAARAAAAAAGNAGGGFHSNFGFTDFSDFFGNAFREAAFTQTYTLQLTLYDLYIGKKIELLIDDERVMIEIEPGMQHGQQLQYRYEDKHTGAIRTIIFIIQEVKDDIYERNNADLYMNLELSLEEAILGFQRIIHFIDGSNFTIQSQSQLIYNSEDILQIDQMGMPIYSQYRKIKGHGRLFFIIKVNFPLKLSLLNQEEQEQLRYLLQKLNNNHHHHHHDKHKNNNSIDNDDNISLKKMKTNNNTNTNRTFHVKKINVSNSRDGRRRRGGVVGGQYEQQRRAKHENHFGSFFFSSGL